MFIIISNVSNNPGSHQTLDLSYLRRHSEEYKYDQELHCYLHIQSRRKTCCYTRQYTSWLKHSRLAYFKCYSKSYVYIHLGIPTFVSKMLKLNIKDVSLVLRTNHLVQWQRDTANIRWKHNMERTWSLLSVNMLHIWPYTYSALIYNSLIYSTNSLPLCMCYSSS